MERLGKTHIVRIILGGPKMVSHFFFKLDRHGEPTQAAIATFFFESNNTGLGRLYAQPF